MKPVLALAMALAVSGCAGTYKAPAASYQPSTHMVSANKADIMRAAKIVLASDGYQMTLADDDAGVISTAPRNLRLTPQQASCGTTMGLDYLKDKRTSTTVSLSVIAGDGVLTVRSTVQGEYKVGAVAQDITLECVSLGSVEAATVDRIKALL